MKTKLLMGAAVAVLILAGVFALKASTDAERIAFGISMDHLEAIANDETKAGYCYYKAGSGSDGSETGWFFECDYRTNSTTIYTCPSMKSSGVQGSSDRCTK